jgi:hypothetical protein
MSFLSPMMADGRATALDRSRQTQLMLWAVKTAMVFEYALAGSQRYFTFTDRERLRITLLPPYGTSVWVGWLPEGGNGCLNIWLPLLRASRAMVGHSATICVGQFIIQVLAHSAPEFSFGNSLIAWDDQMIRIWPLRSEGEIWPPAPIAMRDLLRLGHRFSRGPVPRHGTYGPDNTLKP